MSEAGRMMNRCKVIVSCPSEITEITASLTLQILEGKAQAFISSILLTAQQSQSEDSIPNISKERSISK